MTLTLLGSAAAEGFPGLFCECEHCIQARNTGGKNLRLRTVALLNNDLLLDFGPDLLAALQRHQLSLANVTVALITHFHDDHWLLSNLLYRHHWFRQQALPRMDIYGGPRLLDEVAEICSRHSITPEDMEIAAHVVQAGDEFITGDYRVKVLPAAHSQHVNPLFYAITQGEKRMIYATDTGPLSEAAFVGMRGFGAQLLVMEMTMGSESHEYHLGRSDFLATVARLRKEEALTGNAQIVAHHFSHHHTPLHEELEKRLALKGIIAGYDGLEVIF
jgi:phosphoribosyl 1,2-cyclic phosphate phosphodiesterase